MIKFISLCFFGLLFSTNALMASTVQHSAEIIIKGESASASKNSLFENKITSYETQDIEVILRHRIRYLNWLADSVKWPEIKSKHLLGVGSSSSVVPLIRLRLKLLDRKTFTPLKANVYSAELAEAVKEFQLRHGLKGDGVVGPNTLKWLNMKPEKRAELLAKNMSARKKFFKQTSERYILVNIPAYELLLQNKDEVALRSRVIVGKPLKPTPVLTSAISSVVLNPRWRVPRSIVKDDLLPKVRRNGDFLSSGKFSVFNYENKRVDKQPDEWQQLAKGDFPYRIEQSAGKHNALGRYKLYFPNNHSVYLHDTSNKQLFDKEQRALSSGCIRIDKVDDLTDWIADNLLGNKSKWNKVKSTRTKTKWFKLAVNLPVHLVYWTAWIDEKGSSQFRSDIYGYHE